MNNPDPSHPYTAAEFSDLESRARRLSALMPSLILSARQIAQTLVHGTHGRKRAGPGETFWQFRPYSNQEPAKRIDWRRSASTDHLFVREQEWDTAHTFWLWIDLTPSMWYQSRLGRMTKAERACLLGLSIAEILVRSGERVGILGLMRPSMDRDIVPQMAERLQLGLKSDYGMTAFPVGQDVKRFSEVVLISDFLAPKAQLFEQLRRIGSHQTGGLMVQVIDPAEESFPFKGRVQFQDMVQSEQIIIENARDIQTRYREAFDGRKAELSAVAKQLNWGHIEHHTDQAARAGLLHIYGFLSSHYFATGGMTHQITSSDEAAQTTEHQVRNPVEEQVL